MCRTQPNVFGNFPNHFSYVYYHITVFGHPIVTHTLSIVYLLKKGTLKPKNPNLTTRQILIANRAKTFCFFLLLENTLFTMKSRPANTSLYRMTYVIGIFALARSKAIFTPVSLRTIFFASGTSESRLAFTSAIYRVTCCIVMTIAFVGTIRTKSPWRTRKTTLRPMPTSRTSTFSIYMIALKILYTYE